MADAMTREISFEDLLSEDRDSAREAVSVRRLLHEGFPLHGGLELLAAIEQVVDSDPALAHVWRGYQQILEIQRRGAKRAG